MEEDSESGSGSSSGSGSDSESAQTTESDSPPKPCPAEKLLIPKTEKSDSEEESVSDEESDEESESPPSSQSPEKSLLPDSDSEDDPVVEEFPVYLNHDLTGQLHLFQYQNRPSTLPFGDEEVVDVKFRPGSKKLQLTTEIDTKSKFYDSVAGVHIATGKAKIDIIEDNEDPEAMDEDKDTTINRQVMEYDAHPLQQESGYYACLKRKKSVHITPITTIGQMRPVYPALDQEEADTAAAEGKDAGTDVSESETEEDTGKIQVKFKRDRTKVQQAKDKTEGFLSQYYQRHIEHENQDTWVKLEYADFDDEVWHKLKTNDDELEAEETEGGRSEIVLREEERDEPMLIDLEPGSGTRIKIEPGTATVPTVRKDLISKKHFLSNLVADEHAKNVSANASSSATSSSVSAPPSKVKKPDSKSSGQVQNIKAEVMN